MPASPLPPRLDALEPVDAESVVDDDEWSGLEIRGSARRDGGSLEIDGCRLVGVALVGSTVERLRVTDTVFEDCDLSGLVAEESDLLRVELRGCRMRGLVLPQSRWRDVRIDGASLDEASLRLASAGRVEITGSSLRDVDLYGAELADAALRSCDLTGVELSSAHLRGTHLQGSTLVGLRGADALRGVVIDPAQVHQVALGILAALEIVVDDDLDDDRDDDRDERVDRPGGAP